MRGEPRNQHSNGRMGPEERAVTMARSASFGTSPSAETCCRATSYVPISAYKILRLPTEVADGGHK